MKKRLYGMLACLLVAQVAVAQVVWMENGVSLSSLRGDWFTGNTAQYQFKVGADYCDRGWFDLSSGIGLSGRGGREDVPFTDKLGELVSTEHVDLLFRYLTVNTLFRVKFTEGRWTVYAGAGPRLDFKVGTRFDSSHPDVPVWEGNEGKKVLYGLDCVCGLKCALGKMHVGLNFCYPWAAGKTYTDLAGKGYRDRIFTLGLVLGYAL